MRSSIFSRLQKKLSHTVFVATKSIRQRLRPVQPELVVFVAGVQRSGTNMLMDVLERSLDTDVYHETDPRAFNTYEMQPVGVIEQLVRASRARVFVIKSLCELQDLSQLMDKFQPAKAVWIVRNYNDSVNSMLVSFRNQAKQVHQVAEDRNGSQWRGRGMSDATHALVRQFDRDDLSDASGAALFWYYRNQLFFDQYFDSDDRVLLVEYDELVMNPGRQIGAIFDFIGLDYTPSISSQVVASSVRKRPPPDIEPEIRQLCEDILDRLRASGRA